jgi:hypothetical protein
MPMDLAARLTSRVWLRRLKNPFSISFEILFIKGPLLKTCFGIDKKKGRLKRRF